MAIAQPKSANLSSSSTQVRTTRHQPGTAVCRNPAGVNPPPTEPTHIQPVTDRNGFQLIINCNQLASHWRRVPSLMAAVLTMALLSGACTTPDSIINARIREIRTADYALLLPADEQKALLILFPCFSCDAADTRSESKIPDEAVAKGVAVLLMNFNRHLLMTDAETADLVGTISDAVRTNKLHTGNTFIGGFSSGGNVTMLLAKALLKLSEPPVHLKGVFAVDPPLDLSHLYEASQRSLARSSFPEYKGEPRMITALLDSVLGNPATKAAAYEARSPLMNTEASVLPLKDLPVRLYTEPDTAWWRENRGAAYEDMNAFALERIYHTMHAVGNDKVEFITTKDRGVQHGHRHPHAWSIVEEQELVRWIGTLTD